MSKLVRFREVTADPTTPDVIVQRLASGESLKEIATAWDVPYKRLLAWVAANGELSEQCKRVRELAGIELRFEGLEIVDGVEGSENSEEIAAAKLRAEYREKLSRDLNKPLFGKFTQHQHTHTVDLGERLRRARERVVGQAGGEAIPAGVTPSLVNPGESPAPAAPPADVVEAEII